MNEKKDIENLNEELSAEELETVSGGAECNFTCSGVFECTTKYTCGSFGSDEELA